jgi:CRISPR-associated Csx2 family protein
MAKVLITSIGKAQLYKPATYYEGENRDETVKTPFVFAALKHFKGFDKCVFIGTCGSDWDVLYEYVCSDDSVKKPDLSIDDDYLSVLKSLNKEKGATEKVDVLSEKLGKLKESMPFETEIVILEYGLNQEEILRNFDKLANSVKKMVKDKDEIYFDITHSFRSLAFYELLAVNYLKDAIGKNVTVEYVSYGMLEYYRENDGLVPIVDLSQLIRMLDLIKAAEEYKRFGTAKLLAELLGNKKNRIGIDISDEEAAALKVLGSAVISTNGIKEFQGLVRRCGSIANDEHSEKNIVLGFIFEDLYAAFGEVVDDKELLRLKLAEWHFEKGRYMESAVCLVECVLDYCAELTGIPNDENADDCVRRRFIKATSSNDCVTNFINNYQIKKDSDLKIKNDLMRGKTARINNGARVIRNMLLHGEKLTEEDLGRLRYLISFFSNTMKENFKGNPKNANELKRALNPITK